jgi:predicted transposase YdaD
MQTDGVFYEVFRFDPQSVAQLVQLKLEGKYDFESITVKTTEKRFDGFLRRIDGEGPHLFLEVQGYPLQTIYLKLYRELCTFYEQREDRTPFIAIVLFLDESFDPGEFGVTCLPPCRLIRANLIDCLKKLEGSSAGALTALMPLALKTRAELNEAAPRWRASIQAMNLTESREKHLYELLMQVLVQKFTDLTEQEVIAMLNLTPFEETTVGKQVYGRGLEKGLSRGELIGKIESAQRVLRRPLSSKEELLTKSYDELNRMLQTLDAELENFLNTLSRS